jgi:hypothetical protein
MIFGCGTITGFVGVVLRCSAMGSSWQEAADTPSRYLGVFSGFTNASIAPACVFKSESFSFVGRVSLTFPRILLRGESVDGKVAVLSIAIPLRTSASVWKLQSRRAGIASLDEIAVATACMAARCGALSGSIPRNPHADQG